MAIAQRGTATTATTQTGGASTISIAYPAGLVAGDCALLAIAANAPSMGPGGASGDAAFTQIKTQQFGGSTGSVTLYMRAIAIGDSGSITFNLSTSTTVAVAVMVAWSGVDTSFMTAGLDWADSSISTYAAQTSGTAFSSSLRVQVPGSLAVSAVGNTNSATYAATGSTANLGAVLTGTLEGALLALPVAASGTANVTATESVTVANGGNVSVVLPPLTSPASPYILDTVTSSSKTTGTTLAVTQSSNRSFAVNSVYLALLALDAAGTVGSGDVTAADQLGNALTRIDDRMNGSASSGVRLVTFRGVMVSTAVPTITFTHPSVTARACLVMRISTPVALDVAVVGANATGTAVNPGTSAATTTANELVICAVGLEGPYTTTTTAGSGYVLALPLNLSGTTGGSGGAATTSNIALQAEMKVAAVTGAQTAAMTLGTSVLHTENLITLKLAPVVSLLPRLALLGVGD